MTDTCKRCEREIAPDDPGAVTLSFEDVYGVELGAGEEEVKVKRPHGRYCGECAPYLVALLQEHGAALPDQAGQ
jgi:hypothetical protein